MVIFDGCKMEFVPQVGTFGPVVGNIAFALCHAKPVVIPVIAIEAPAFLVLICKVKVTDPTAGKAPPSGSTALCTAFVNRHSKSGGCAFTILGMQKKVKIAIES